MKFTLLKHKPDMQRMFPNTIAVSEEGVFVGRHFSGGVLVNLPIEKLEKFNIISRAYHGIKFDIGEHKNVYAKKISNDRCAFLIRLENNDTDEEIVDFVSKLMELEND